MKKGMWALGAGVVIGGAVVAAPQFSGAKVEKGFEQTAAELSQGALQVAVIDYQRGWRDAQARTRWEMVQGGESMVVEVDHAIEHGPTLDGNLARVESTLRLTDAVRDKLRPYFEDKPPLTVLSTVAFSGEQNHHVSSPAYTGPLEEAEVRWQGIQGDIRVTADGTRASGRLEAPELVVDAPEGADVSLQKLVTEFDQHRAPGEAIWLGKAVLGMQQMHLTAPDSGSDDLRSVELVEPRLTSELHGDAETLTMRLAAEAARLSADEQSLEEPVFATSLENIDRAAYGELQSRLQDIAAGGYTPQTQQQLMAPVMMELIPRFLERQPTFKLERLGTRTADGDLEVKGHLQYVGSGAPASMSPVTDLQGELNFRAAESLLIPLLEAGARRNLEQRAMAQGLDVASEELDKAARETVQQQLLSLRQIGWLERTEDDYQTRAALADGQFTVNGQPATRMIGQMMPSGG